MGKKIISMVLLIGLLAIMFFLVFVRGQSLTGKCFGYNEFFADAENDAFLLSKKIGSALKELCPVDKEKFDKNLIKLLEERRKLMLDDIENNPAKVLFIKELPVEIVSKLLDEEKRKLVEKRGRFSGGLDVYHEDYFDERKSRYLFYLNVDGKKYRLFSFQELPVVLSGTRANIEGITFEGEDVMVVDSNSGSFSILDEGEGGGGGVTDDNFGEQRTLVIVLKIGDNDPPLSVEKARGIIFGHEFGTLYDFYFKNSYGRVSFVGDILGPYVLSEDVCNIDFIKDRALEAAREDVRRLGKDYQDYDRLILLHPITPCIRAAGLGSIGKISIDLPNIHGIMSIAWIIDPSPSVLAHELGHNFGVSHASFYECLLANGEQTSYSYDCEKYEYGDSFSVMGYSKLSHHNAFHKKEIGWLTEENILTTREGTFRLRPIETSYPSGEIQAIKIPVEEDFSIYVGDDNLFYVVELRQPLDYDAMFLEEPFFYNIYKGVSVRMATEELVKDTVLMSPSPVSRTWILVGESFIDDINGVKITLKSLEGDGTDAVATISVEQIPRREPPDFNNPLIYYDFNENFRLYRPFTDNAGYIRGGPVEGSLSYPEYLPENFNGGIFFHGTGSFVESGYVEMRKFQDIFIAKNNAFTISTWLNLQNYPEELGIIYGGGIFGMQVKKYGVLESFSRFKFENDYSMAFISSRNPLIKDRWYHLALVFDGEKLRLYINGLEEGNIDTVEFEGRMVRIIDLYERYEVFPYLGGEPSGFGLNGILDEFKIYARGLSEEEIMRLFRNPPLQAQAKFIRGDSNSDGKVDLSDAIFILRYLFQGGENLKCEDAGDVNDDGNIDVSDAIYLLIYLFREGGREPPAPFPEAGLDSTVDELGCGS